MKCHSCGKLQACGCISCHYCGYNNNTGFHSGAGIPCPKSMKTQKVKGIAALAGAGFKVPALRAIQHEKDEQIGIAYWPTFARPCPVDPCHGFVDSRVIKSEEERLKVVEETYAADPQGEIIYMEPIDAAWNAIWTPALLTVGAGHDGATAGKGAILFPLAGVMPKQFTPKMLELAGFKDESYPYVEVVGLDDGSYWLTQLRAGPKLESITPDYIPAQVKVKRVIPASVDIPLLKWKSMVEAMKPGDVVWHPNGTLTDHISVHARVAAIPCMRREPIIGEVLEPIPAPPWDPGALLRGAVIADGWKMEAKDAKQATNLLLLALHNAVALTGDHTKWLGMATVLMLKLGSIACRGELRHVVGSKMGKEARQKVWARYWGKSIRFHRAGLARMGNVFRYGEWQSNGFGGFKWAQCAFALAPLYNALARVAREPTEESTKALVGALNIAVNQAHNGGWWLNKFTSGNALDQIQKAELGDIMPILPLIRTLDPLVVGEAETARKITRWADWKDVSIRPPAIKDVEASMMPYSGGLQLRVKTRLTGRGEGRKVDVPLEKLFPQLLAQMGDLILVASDQGLKVEARKKGEAPVVLWEEEPVVPIEPAGK